MPFLSDNQTVATTVVIANVLAGKFNRTLQENSKVTVAMTASVVSGFATVIVGRELLIDAQEIPDTAASPRNPEDILAQTVGRAGEEVIIGVRNANAGNNVIRTHVYIEPI
jgi:hypothetical protein